MSVDERRRERDERVSMQTCPRCDGQDMTTGVVRVNRGEAGCTVEQAPPCYMCGGSGQITAEHADQYRIGEAFHAARRQARRTLGDISLWWRVSPSVISKAEQDGIGAPWIFERMAKQTATWATPQERSDQ